MLKLTWTETGLDDLAWWVDKNPKSGIGKPEPLGYELQGYWSRRITQEHRLVYAFDDVEVAVIQCRFHYERP